MVGISNLQEVLQEPLGLLQVLRFAGDQLDPSGVLASPRQRDLSAPGPHVPSGGGGRLLVLVAFLARGTRNGQGRRGRHGV